MGVFLDCSRNAVFKPEEIKKFVDYISAMGYKTLYLYTEDTYNIPEEPYFGYLRGRYSAQEIRDVDEYCKTKGIELIPAIQTLAHLGAITRWQKYYQITDIDDILLVGDERTYELIEKMFKTISEVYSSKKIHIGMDEAHNIGRGKYFDCNGVENKLKIMSEHLKRVLKIARKYGLEPQMWSDMYFRFANNGVYSADGMDENLLKLATENMDKDVEVVYWNYYTQDKAVYNEMFRIHKKYFNKVSFAGGAICWYGYAPRNDMSLKIADAAVQACRESEIDDITVTLWGDNGGQCSFFSVLPSLLYYAERVKGNDDLSSIKKKFFDIVGETWDSFMDLDLPNKIAAGKDYLSNPASYMFYNDFFSGSFDSTVKLGDGADYAVYAKKLQERAKNSKKFSYIFDALAKLCSVMEIKYELGVKTRIAYQNKDKKELFRLAENEYTVIQQRLKDFAAAFSILWETENKTSGAEVEDLRIGGLIQRSEHCKRLLLQYVENGSEIAELEDTLLEFYGDGEKLRQQPIVCNQYHLCATVNTLSHGLK